MQWCWGQFFLTLLEQIKINNSFLQVTAEMIAPEPNCSQYCHQ